MGGTAPSGLNGAATSSDTAKCAITAYSLTACSGVTIDTLSGAITVNTTAVIALTPLTVTFIAAGLQTFTQDFSLEVYDCTPKIKFSALLSNYKS